MKRLDITWINPLELTIYSFIYVKAWSGFSFHLLIKTTWYSFIQVNLILPIVRTDNKDPGVQNTDIDEGNELCENIFIGAVEIDDLFFEAKSHKDQETNIHIKSISLISNASVSKSNSDPAPKALEVSNAVQSPSSIDPCEGLEDLGTDNTKKNNEVLSINNYDIEPIDLYQIYFQNPKDY